MAKSKNSEEISLIESAWGVLGGFINLLVKMARELNLPSGTLYRLGTPDGEATLVAATRAFLAEVAKTANIFRVKIGGRRTIAEVVGASGYTWVNPTILERRSLSGGRERWAAIEVFDIERFNHDPTDAEIEAEYERRGLTRPEVDHAIHFGEQHPSLPVEGQPVVFYLKKPVLDAGGGSDVLSLWRYGAGRELSLGWLGPGGRWYRFYRFAGVRE